MPWSMKADGNEVEVTGRLVLWVEAIDRSYSERKYLPLDRITWLALVTGGYARCAAAKWQSAWFSKGKLEGLKKLTSDPKNYKPFAVLDYLAERFNTVEREQMHQQAVELALNVAIGDIKKKEPLMALLLEKTQEKGPDPKISAW